MRVDSKEVKRLGLNLKSSQQVPSSALLFFRMSGPTPQRMRGFSGTSSHGFLRNLAALRQAALAWVVQSIPNWYLLRTLACSCGQAGPGTCGDFAALGPSFVGTVIDVENPPDERRDADESGLSRYRFRIEENLIGFSEKEVDIYSGRGSADCSYHFRLGQSYLVIPYTIGQNKIWLAGICNGTGPTANAGPLLEKLRARRDSKIDASVEGYLRTKQQPYNSTFYTFYNHPLAGITVELLADSRTYSTQTDQNGAYRFDGVPEGTYRFAAELPPHFELAQNGRGDSSPSITVAAQPCYSKDFNALPTARIGGRVIGSEGLPLKNADVVLSRRERYNETQTGWWTVQSDENGHFEFDHVTPGLYLIVFNNSNRSDPNLPYARTFYPNAPDFESAVPIAIGEDDQIKGDQEVLRGC
jgi:hypothetical protein